MKCWILPQRKCMVETSELPLEVCKVCVEAYLEHLRNPVIKRRDEPPKAELGDEGPSPER